VIYAEETVRSGDGHVGDKEHKSNGMLGITCRTVKQKQKIISIRKGKGTEMRKWTRRKF
jgi:hypothetical protein